MSSGGVPATALGRSRLAVLMKLADGKMATTAAKELRISRQAVEKHVRKLIRAGFLAEDRPMTELQRHALGGGRGVVFALTDRGREAISGAMSTGLPPGAEGGLTLARPFVEAHNFEVKIPIKKLPFTWLPDKADLQNWTRQWDPDFHGTYLEVTTKHVLIRAGAEGKDREEAEGRTLARLFRVMELLERYYGWELGRPEFRLYGPGRGKIGVVGLPAAAGLPYQVGDLAMIDNTPEPGTVHPKDPNDADRLVALARNAERTRLLVEQMAALEVRLSEAVLVALGSGQSKGPVPPAPPGPEVV